LLLNYEEDLRPITSHAEDLDHGAMDIATDVLLNILLNFRAQQFKKPLAPPVGRVRADIVKNTQDSNFRHDVAGHGERRRTSQQPLRRLVTMARADSKIYQTCHDVSLRIVDGAAALSQYRQSLVPSANKKLRHNRSATSKAKFAP